MRTQRRGLKVAMSPEEVDAFLRQERVCRLATVGPDGTPRSNPLWFVWHDRGLWLYSLVGTQRWANIDRNPSVSARLAPAHPRQRGQLGLPQAGPIRQIAGVVCQP